MPTIGKPMPKFFRFVSKPQNAANSELAQAQPVYIDGLPEGGDGGTTESVLTEGLAENEHLRFPDGEPLNDVLVSIAQNLDGASTAFADIFARLEALENAQPAG